jgi:hypothetical protein
MNADSHEEAGDSETSFEQPTFRGVVRKGQLWISSWEDVSLGGDFLTTHGNWDRTDQPGVFDLILTGQNEDEIIVVPCNRDCSASGAEEILSLWASALGYTRIWFEDSVVKLEPDPAQVGTLSLDCDICGFQMDVDSPELWLACRDGGSFLRNCLACGSLIPQYVPTSILTASAHKPATIRT